MNSKNPCRQRHADRTSRSSAAAAIDSRTRQALFQLRLHTEELALELAVRLRVLGNGMSAACQIAMADANKSTAESFAYANLRGQLDGFLGSHINGEFAKFQSFTVIRRYLLDTLPQELKICVSGGPCRLEIVEALVAMLSGNGHEHDGFAA